MAPLAVTSPSGDTVRNLPASVASIKHMAVRLELGAALTVTVNVSDSPTNKKNSADLVIFMLCTTV